MPASAAIAAPPRRISRIMAVGMLLMGMPRIASAKMGLPPIA
jgi:hypothetical protein